MTFIGSRLRYLREQAGYSQETLAGLLKTTQAQLWKWENNEAQPRTQTLIAMSQILNTSVDYLLGLVDSPSDVLVESDLSNDEIKLLNAYRTGDIKQILKILSSGGDE